MTIMKKEYISPLAETVSVDCESIIAQSFEIDKDSSGSEQLSNRHSGGKWGDLWKQ